MIEGVPLPRQPIGELLTWMAAPHDDKFSHCEFTPSYEQRCRARERSKTSHHELYMQFVAIEREGLPEDQPDEPL